MKAVIVALVDDERLQAPIQALADKLDYEIVWSLDVEGVISKVADLRPVVLLADLHDDTQNWQLIARALKTNSATRRLALIGFAENLTPAARDEAISLLFDEIFEAVDSPTDILTSLEARIESLARREDAELHAALISPCQQPMPDLVRKGIKEFNTGNYYEAHEDLEHAWMAEDGVVRNLYQGILQVGVAYHQIERHNYWGAIKMFLRAFQWLSAMPDMCHGIDVARLRQDARHAWHTLEALGPDRIAEFDTGLFQPVHFIEE